MLGLDGRAARASWTVLFIALLVLVTYLIRRTLLIFVCALLFAYLLSPLVDLVDRFAAKRFPRNLSLAVVYLVLIVALVSAAAAIGAQIGQQAAQLASRLPQYLRNPQLIAQWEFPPLLEEYLGSALEALRAQLEVNTQEILPVLREAGEQLVSVIGNLVFIILVPILSFFFLKDSAAIRQTLLNQFLDERGRGLLEDILADVHLMLAQFMRALVMLCTFTFLVYWIFLAILGVPYALLLAVIAGVVEFIPVAGPLAASVAIVLVSLFSGYPHLIWVLVFLVAYRLFLDYLIWPHLIGAGMELPPAAVILGVLAGEQIGGVMGMFLSVPAIAVLRIVYVRFRKGRQAAMPGPVEP